VRTVQFPGDTSFRVYCRIQSLTLPTVRVTIEVTSTNRIVVGYVAISPAVTNTTATVGFIAGSVASVSPLVNATISTVCIIIVIVPAGSAAVIVVIMSGFVPRCVPISTYILLQIPVFIIVVPAALLIPGVVIVGTAVASIVRPALLIIIATILGISVGVILTGP